MERMAGSAGDAISPAVERSKQLLFPFKAEKWFALGFTVFLAQCGEGGGGGSFNIPSWPSGSSPTGSSPGGSGGGSLPSEFQKIVDGATRALHDHLGLYVALGAGAVLLLLGLWMLVLWLSSRAKLMFVESVIWDRVDVSTQWSRAAELGLSLFKFRAAFGVAGAFLILGALGAGAFVAWPDFQAGSPFGPRALVGYSLFGAAVLFFAFPLGILLALLDDFVVPLMVTRNARVGDAWGAFRAEVLPGNVGGLILFYLLRMVLGMATAMIAALLTCFTCCLTAIPYIGTVMLLPIWVFWRAYPLYYLEQLGVRIFPSPEPSWAQYEQWRFPQ